MLTRRSLAVATLLALLLAGLAWTQDPKPAEPGKDGVTQGPAGRPAHLCDLKTLDQGWRCKKCDRLKDRKGDCCPPPCKCGPAGCPDDELRLTIVCVKGAYACENGCKGSEATEPGKCRLCGSVLKLKGTNRAEVFYRCPKCGRTEQPRPTFTCDHCGPVAAVGKGYLCPKCNKPVHVDFVPVGKCPDDGEPMYRNCDKAGTPPHVAGSKPPAADAGADGPEKEPPKKDK